MTISQKFSETRNKLKALRLPDSERDNLPKSGRLLANAWGGCQWVEVGGKKYIYTLNDFYPASNRAEAEYIISLIKLECALDKKLSESISERVGDDYGPLYQNV